MPFHFLSFGKNKVTGLVFLCIIIHQHHFTMETLPIYISLFFGATTLLTLWFFYKATRQSKPIIISLLVWMALQSVIGLTGFYKVTNTLPPRFALLILPPLLFIAILFISTNGRRFIDSWDIKTLTLLHVARIPVEVTLLWLFLHKAVPQRMTFEGSNFDILSGLTAPIIYYFGFVKKVLNKYVLLGWNLFCLILLFNIVRSAVLSAPFPFQQYAFDQPNVALLYFPFVWLPAVVVPIVLLSHLVTIRQLLRRSPEPLAVSY
jgi:hypothetical protein